MDIFREREFQQVIRKETSITEQEQGDRIFGVEVREERMVVFFFNWGIVDLQLHVIFMCTGQ